MRIFMNNKEQLNKVVIEACINGKLTNEEASKKLKYSIRYIKKLKQNYRKKGEEIFIHGNCGKQPVSTINADLRSKVVQLKQSYKYEETNIDCWGLKNDTIQCSSLCGHRRKVYCRSHRLP